MPRKQREVPVEEVEPPTLEEAMAAALDARPSKIAKTKPTMFYIPEQWVPGKYLGRSVAAFDPKSRGYAAINAFAGRKPGNRTWHRRGVFDQGATFSCCGQTAAGILLTSPNRQTLTETQKHNLDAILLYRLAQSQFDEWHGAEPDYYGTSVLAVFKAMKHLGLIAEYRWCFGLKDVLATLTHYGPVGIGVDWYDSFDEPGHDGRISISPDAVVRGGHAVELTGINSDEKTVRGVQSWGPEWGDKGRFEMTWDDLDQLLNQQGEAVTVVVAEREEFEAAA